MRYDNYTYMAIKFHDCDKEDELGYTPFGLNIYGWQFC